MSDHAMTPIDIETAREGENQEAAKLRQRAREHLGAGLGLGVLSLGAAIAVGATCPLCVVAVPALLGSGVWHGWKAKLAKREAASEE